MGIREYLKNGSLGFGAAPLGNMFRNIPDAEAAATVRAAWTEGTRFFDTAPFYGAGLSEIRLGKELVKHKRSEYLLSSKVGCEECLKIGDTWVHLRMCLHCGHVGCCNSSKNKHATKHFQARKHPIARSIEPGESWAWCYVDELMLDIGE